MGRFLQPDPLGYIDGLNLYAYVNNNPLNWVDPWGLLQGWANFFNAAAGPHPEQLVARQEEQRQRDEAFRQQIKPLLHSIDHVKLASFELIAREAKARHLVDPFNQNSDVSAFGNVEKKADQSVKKIIKDFLNKQRDKHNKRFHPEPPTQPEPEPESKTSKEACLCDKPLLNKVIV